MPSALPCERWRHAGQSLLRTAHSFSNVSPNMSRLDRPIESVVESAVLPSDSQDGIDAQIPIDQQLHALSCQVISLTDCGTHSKETLHAPQLQQPVQISKVLDGKDKIQNYYTDIDEAFFADSGGDRYSALNVGTLSGEGDVARDLLNEFHSQIGDVFLGQIESFAPVPVASDLQAIMASLHASQNDRDDDLEPVRSANPVESNRKLDLLNFSSFIIPETKSPQLSVTNCESSAASSQKQVQPLEAKPRSDEERIESAVMPLAGNDKVIGVIAAATTLSPMESIALQPESVEKNDPSSDFGQVPNSVETELTRQNTSRKRRRMDSQALLKSFDNEELELPGPVASFIDQISQSNLAELNSLKAELESILKKPEPASVPRDTESNNQS